MICLVGVAWLAAGCDAPGVVGSDAGTSDMAAIEPNPLATEVDELFAAAASDDTFSGSVLVIDGGKQVLARAYGAADRTADRANQPTTIFRIGSVSKQFTAAAILLLVQDGQLSLEDPVAKLFPDYPAANLEKNGVEVTIHHLLSHTSGLPDPRQTDAFKDIVWSRAIDPREQVEMAMPLPLVREPGTACVYTNYNFLLAALIVEIVSGQTYETFLRERIFAPLGMNDTGTILAPSRRADAAVGYSLYEGMLSSFADEPYFHDPDVSFSFGSGQIYSTVEDLARWDRALATDTPLTLSMRNRLWQPNLDDYAYGWIVERKPALMQWHNGAIAPLGFYSIVVRVPSKDRFLAVLANRDVDLVESFEAKILKLAQKN